MTVEQLTHAGLEHHRADRLDAAEACYRQALAISGYPPALNMLGVVLAQTGRRPEGIKYMERAVQLRPGSRVFKMNLGAAYAEARRFDRALGVLLQALDMSADEDVLLRLARAAFGARRLTDMVRFAEQVIALNAASGDGWGCLALAHLMQFQPDEARIMANRALLLKPDQPEALRSMALIALQAGQVDDAVRWAEQALAAQPEYIDGLVTLAQIRLRLGRDADAEAIISTILARENDVAEAYGVRMALRVKQQRIADAILDADRAVALRPDMAELIFNRGRLREGTGKLDGARADYQTALRLRPDFLPARQALAALDQGGKV